MAVRFCCHGFGYRIYAMNAICTDEFRDFFTRFGDVKDHQIMRDHSTNRSRGFGFITFDSEEAVEDLLSKGNKIDFAGSQVRNFVSQRYILCCDVLSSKYRIEGKQKRR